MGKSVGEDKRVNRMKRVVHMECWTCIRTPQHTFKLSYTHTLTHSYKYTLTHSYTQIIIHPYTHTHIHSHTHAPID